MISAAEITNITMSYADDETSECGSGGPSKLESYVFSKIAVYEM